MFPPPQCLFCAIRPADSEEHIILNALGGRKGVDNFSCEPCNNRFGSTIDKNLEEAFRFISLLIGAHNGKNKPVAPILMERSDTREQVRVEHGGNVSSVREVIVTIVDDAKVETRQLKKFNEQAIAQILAAAAKQRGQPLGEESAKLVQRDGGITPIDLSGGFGGPEQFRSVAKMALAALAKKGLLTGGPETMELVRWIDSAEGTWSHTLDPAAYQMARQALGTSDGEHTLAVWCVAGQAEATFLAFGFIPYRVHLPIVGTFEPFVHVVNPVAKTHEVRAITKVPSLSPIENAIRSQVQDNEALQALFAWVDLAARDAVIKRAIAATFEDLRREGAEELEYKHISKVAADVAQALFQLPRSTELDTTRITELAKQILSDMSKE